MLSVDKRNYRLCAQLWYTVYIYIITVLILFGSAFWKENPLFCSLTNIICLWSFLCPTTFSVSFLYFSSSSSVLRPQCFDHCSSSSVVLLSFLRLLFFVLCASSSVICPIFFSLCSSSYVALLSFLSPLLFFFCCLSSVLFSLFLQ